MASQQIDLQSLFKQVSKSVKQQQTSLNQADSYNHDHGDHMVEIFDVITQAMKAKKNAEPADQLEYAAQLLRNKTKSGSGQVYANGLEQAAKQVLGKELNINTIMSIIQALMGSAQKPGQSGSQDVLGSLVGSILGGGSSSQGGSTGQGGADVLGSLVGSVLGGQSQGGQTASSNGIDIGDLLGAGMEYMNAKQSGKSDLEAITGALVSGSTMAQEPHRAQSGEVVTSALLKALGSMMNK